MSNGIDFGLSFRKSASYVDEIQEERLRHAGHRIPFNISFLDDRAFGILPTDLVIIAAQTGAGKTTLGTLLALMAAKSGKWVHYFALEAHRREIEQRLLFREMQRLVWARQLDGRRQFTYAAWVHGLCEQLSNQVYAEARETLVGSLANMSTYYRDRRFTKDDIVKLFTAIQNESDLIVFDHLHYVDSDDQNENRAMKDIVKTLGDTALEIETPVIGIAHLRKKDNRKPRLVPALADFHGASDITKIATKCIVLAPAEDRESSNPSVSNTYMQVVKDRLVGYSSYVGLIGFDQRTTSYENRYRLGRLNAAGDKFEAISPQERPWWAEKALCTGAPKQVQENML